MKKSWCFLSFLFSLAALFFLIQHKYIEKTASYRETRLNRYRLLEDLLTEYKTRLREMPKQKYEEKSRFVDIGPAIANVTRKFLSKTKLILTWTKFFQHEMLFPDMSPTLCEGEELTCEVTRDKSRLLSSHGVIMHGFDLRFEALPTKRLPSQRWIFLTHEPRHKLRITSLKKYNGVFNWTFSYRRDSDVPYPFARFGRREGKISSAEHHDMFVSIMGRKTRLVTIMMSNCDDIKNNRLELLQEIRQHLPVDFYGSCGNLSCPTKQCNAIMWSYKFYLSFENSNCRDYISEKAVRPLIEWESVPIVFGASEEEYARVLPPESYINAQGFGSAARLAEYIRLLDENDELYMRYHSWRKTYKQLPFSMCELCKALHDPARAVQSYRDFAGWYNEDIC